ncbi:type II toxin-antitoxin system RelE/ParE family toxin [Legionella gresilensis]|uniref:type II toxin-antitoxin system RelE/ParE family toxin n=1 Tax=Legionella gresilensis TaxID=91823 RepID=UPI001040FBE2|nr:type II toxin-antitoxin system RelE/ParE family toxin [Legionella gresilensis]
MNDINKLITVVETAEFIKQASKFMSDETRREFIDYIAASPCSGDLITGTGGVRKVRWASDPAKGKSGGSRVIYFYHNDNMPLFLFTAYSKATRENISQSERNALKMVVKQLVDIYRSDNND